MLNIDVTSNGIMIQKMHGPFVTDIPGLNKGDVYKFMVYTAMKNNFTLLSAEHISAIGAREIAYDKQFFQKHNMGEFNLETFSLSSQKSIKQTGYNTCVVDYFWSQCMGKCGFKSYTFDKLKSELRDYASYYPMRNTEEIID